MSNGYSPYSQNFSLARYQPQQASGGSGGGGLGSILGMLGGGAMMSNPATAGIMMGGQLLSGILGGILEGQKQKKKEKAFKQAQQAYQSKASSLFPELNKESFQYQNPTLNNAIQSALGYRMGNMFGDWGMPKGRTQGMGSLNDLFSALMQPQPQQYQQQPMQSFKGGQGMFSMPQRMPLMPMGNPYEGGGGGMMPPGNPGMGQGGGMMMPGMGGGGWYSQMMQPQRYMAY